MSINTAQEWIEKPATFRKGRTEGQVKSAVIQGFPAVLSDRYGDFRFPEGKKQEAIQRVVEIVLAVESGGIASRVRGVLAEVLDPIYYDRKNAVGMPEDTRVHRGAPSASAPFAGSGGRQARNYR